MSLRQELMVVPGRMSQLYWMGSVLEEHGALDAQFENPVVATGPLVPVATQRGFLLD